MAKPGITILDDSPGKGPYLKKGDRVRVVYDIQLNRGDYVAKDDEGIWVLGDRNIIAGIRYGIEGMRAGGTRRFKASPHLCYGDQAVEGIPQEAVLICTIKRLERLG